MEDCPICAVNLKRLWCGYTCNATKAYFVHPTGYQYSEIDPTERKYTLVNFTVEKDYACTLFRSCEKESFIAEAALTSSIAFLDFLGYNGKE